MPEHDFQLHKNLTYSLSFSHKHTGISKQPPSPREVKWGNVANVHNPTQMFVMQEIINIKIVRDYDQKCVITLTDTLCFKKGCAVLLLSANDMMIGQQTLITKIINN